ncbi:hypothetical protein J1G42_16005 [Cellulomonas sp. zg-ZUI222]|uniref:DUF5709 domain-containing protein n=1 Tax=Cellulomonas wangleii TaxID=2816956 RepID=A0ABX8D799_9CELL|nr:MULTISPECIES: hypothetical protein [Cellulomonas]MBO0901555.1 hypothetical protein [Cellulomonas sp. zg-ZUI22]MBO0922326.1 hypothetical protein [Cellulomonas wangleii]MBO0926021.1 hypothetical protein [Cellulomonas wangleii]QVI63315.1 hypothetical protein KG103_05340 [Cellulomonas wangleii]
MSTVPGAQSWRDAGLAPVDTEQPLTLTDADETADDEPEDHVPGFPRPDREGRAEEADVVEQSAEVHLDDDEGADA